MLGWDFGDITFYVVMLISLVISILAGIKGSPVHKACFKEGSGPSEKRLKALRILGIVGIVILCVSAIASRIAYVVQNR